MKDRHTFWPRLFGAAAILALALTAACASPATPTAAPAPTQAQATATGEGDHDHEAEATATGAEADHDHEAAGTDTGTEADHEHSDVKIPNDGAVVRIVSPADGATVSGGEIQVKIEVENFPLGEDGRHWHVYLDGEEAAMVEGKDTSYVLHGVAAGAHELMVSLANGEHQELEDGATVNITVTQ